MADQNTEVVTRTGIQDPLINRFFLSQEEKQKKVNGKAIVRAFYIQQTSTAGSNNTTLNYFQARKSRQEALLLWAKGAQSLQEFLDYMNVSDGNKAWVNMDMTPQRIAAQFVGTLVESMAKNKTYACVNAIDDGSKDEKEDRLLDALFRMRELETIKEAQSSAGIQLEPTNAYVPDDELSAKVYFQLEDRLPKEIRFEEMLSMVLDNIKFDRVANRKTLYDLTVLNAAVTKIEKITDGKYTVRKCISNNVIYNFFMNDSGEWEITEIGEIYNVKVKDFRSKYGKSPENPDGLSEEEIYKLAKLSTNKNVGTFNYSWDTSYSLNTYIGNRPYDDCSILVLDCSINCGCDVYYVAKTDSYGKENIQAKKNIPYQLKTRDGKIIEQDKPENVQIIKKNKREWMRGVYAPYGDAMLYWGQEDLIINQFTDASAPLSTWTINIPNNDGNYVPSLFERIMEPLREYSITKLKRKQLIASLVPHGIRVDVESARNIDLGTGDTVPWEEVIRIYQQTGNEIWSSKGVDPLQPASPPLSNTVADTSVQKIIELTNVLQSIVGEIRQLIGVPQYRDGSDVGERTSGVLQEQQESASYNVTDFVLNANNQLWEETCYKLCLLHWNDVVKQEPESKEDLLNTRFKVQVKMKSTEVERSTLEKDIDRYSQMPDAEGNPSLTPLDANRLREIDNGKLAGWYLGKTWEQNRRRAALEKDKREQANIQSQQASAKQANDQLLAIQKDKLASDKEMKEFESTKEKELALLNGLMQSIAKGIIQPQVIMPAIQQLVPNITIPLSLENAQMTQSMQQAASGAPPDDEGAEDTQGLQEQPQGEMAEQNQQPVMQ